MGQNKSAQEVEQEHIRAMGPSLGPLYHELHNEVTWVHAKWLEYRKLYAHSPERIALLNRISKFFFWVVQDVLWNDVLLHIARLTDPPKQGPFDSLTLRRLPDTIGEPLLAANVEKLLASVRVSSAFAREWRNRRIAHRDLSLALEIEQAKPLPGVSRKHVEDSLRDIRAVLNCVHSHYFQGEVAFEMFISSGGAEHLVCQLGLAAREEDRRLERMRNGRPLPEDFDLPPEI